MKSGTATNFPATCTRNQWLSPIERGSLLIITLWMVTILAVLAVAIGRYLSTDVRIAKYRLAREQARALARGGVALAITRLQQEAAPESLYEWLSQPWVVPASTQTRDASIVITITDEESKLNLNGAATDQLLQTALSRLVPADVAARIVDYVDADPDLFVFPGGGATGLETDESRQPPYVAKNAAAAALEELLDIPGLGEASESTSDVFPALQMFTSVLRKDSQVNLNTVSTDVMVALGFRQDTADAIEACRQRGIRFTNPTQPLEGCIGAEGLDANEQSLLLNQVRLTSSTFAIASEGIVEVSARGPQEAVVRARVQAVVRFADCEGGVPACVVAWREG